MGNGIKVEERQENPKLLVVNLQDDKKLLKTVLDHFNNRLSLYLFSKKSLQFPGVHQLSSVTSYILPNVKDKIDYCMLFPSESHKETISYIEKLSHLSKNIVVILKRNSKSVQEDYLKNLQENPRVSIILLGNVFGENYLDSQCSKIIAKSILNKKFYISEDALVPTFVISENDMLLGLEYVLFSHNQKKSSYELYYKHINTLTSLMHNLRRVEPELSVTYAKNVKKQHKSSALEELQGVPVEIDEHIQKIYRGFENEVRGFTEHLKYGDIDSEKKKRKVPKLIRKTGRLTGFILVSFFLFIAVSVIGLLSSVYFYKNAASAFLQGNFTKAEKDMIIAKNTFQYVNPQILFMAKQLDLVSGSNTAKIIDSYSDVLNLSSEVFLFAKNSIENKELTAETANSLSGSAILLYFLLQNNMQSDSLPESFKNYLPLLSVLRDVAGFKREMTYLVLFQNDNELRPTGGFIGSVALLRVKNGKINDVDVSDVYELDGQLKDHVEPNYVIRRYLQPHLYLRDSNFHPDFSHTASAAANLYNLETGNSVDGVIAVDTHVFEVLVDIMGEMYLPGLRKKVTKKDIVKVIQDSIHDDFFPGSTEKKDILNAVLSKIIIGLENDNKKKIEFLRVLPSLFSEKHIQIAFNDESLQKAVVAVNVGGSLQDLRLKDGKLLDTVSVNEANIGVNKVNEFVIRKVRYNAMLHNSELSSDILSEYKNIGNEDYTMYFRVIVPKDSLLESVVIDGQGQIVVPAVTDPVFYEKKGFTPPQGLEVSEEKLTEELKAYGFRIVVPKKSEKRIRVLINRPFFELPTTFDYSLRYIKQPGTLPYSLTLALQLDNSFKFSDKMHNANPVLFSGEVRKDMELSSKVLKIN